MGEEQNEEPVFNHLGKYPFGSRNPLSIPSDVSLIAKVVESGPMFDCEGDRMDDCGRYIVVLTDSGDILLSLTDRTALRLLEALEKVTSRIVHTGMTV